MLQRNGRLTFKQAVGRILIPRLPVNRRTFDILRHELRAMRATVINSLNPGYYARVRRLRRQTGLSVNLGSGGKGQDGWVNIDICWHKDTTLRLDVRRRLPFATGSVRRLLAEHVVEHMDFKHDIPLVFAEFRRILEPHGTVRIIVPDAGRYLQAYASGDEKEWRSLGWDLNALPDDLVTPMHLINHVFHQGGEHLFGYDYATLEYALRNAGFQTVIKQQFGVSRDPLLAIDQANHRPYSLYVEAVPERLAG
jgi:predicted SAM-dependent methyltransferase